MLFLTRFRGGQNLTLLAGLNQAFLGVREGQSQNFFRLASLADPTHPRVKSLIFTLDYRLSWITTICLIN